MLHGDAFCLDAVMDEVAVDVDVVGLQMEHWIMRKGDN